MTKELAKTLTTALVQFIDRERPEGTMCCSNVECERLEKALEEDEYKYVETFIRWKLLGLTKFEQEVSDIVEYCKEHGEHVAFDYAKRHAKTLLALAKKELARQSEVITLDKLAPYDKGFQDGKAEALKDLPRWKKYPFNAGDKPVINGIMQSDGSYEWRIYLNGYKIEISDLKKLPGFKD